MLEAAKQELIRLLKEYVQSLPITDRLVIGPQILICPCPPCKAIRELFKL